MAHVVEGALTLTMMEEGHAARLPALRVSVTPPNGPAVTASLGVRPRDRDERGVQWPVTDPRMSRRHCELRLTGRGVALRNLDSKNGVLVGDVPVLVGCLPAPESGQARGVEW